jgi:hypothetical protein
MVRFQWRFQIVEWLPFLCAAAVGLGCAAQSPWPTDPPQRFGEVRHLDGWSEKISEWQQRALLDRKEHRAADPPFASRLQHKYHVFRDTQADALRNGRSRQEVGEAIALWLQEISKEHFRSEEGSDHWPVFKEVLQSGYDDCDGLELLGFQLLRELGFREAAIFRAVFYQPEDGRHHMVTVWFEDAQDPWVIDPTGALAFGMRRLSSYETWTPVRLFTEEQELALH